MGNKTKADGHGGQRMTPPDQLGSLADRLGECVDELDSLGKFCEANHVALARDLVLREREAQLLVLPE